MTQLHTATHSNHTASHFITSIALYHTASQSITQHRTSSHSITLYNTSMSTITSIPCTIYFLYTGAKKLMPHITTNCHTQLCFFSNHGFGHETVSIIPHGITLNHTPSHCITVNRAASHSITQHQHLSHCNTLNHTASHCITLQHTASQCNTQHHTVSHCITLSHWNDPMQRLLIYFAFFCRFIFDVVIFTPN